MYNKVLNDLIDLRDKEVEVFGQPTILDGKPEENDLIIDAVDYLEHLNSSLELVDDLTSCYYFTEEGLDEITDENGEVVSAEYKFYEESVIDRTASDLGVSTDEFINSKIDAGTNEVFEDENGDLYYDLDIPDELDNEFDSVEAYIEELEDNYVLKEVRCGNTFNESVRINHHMNITIYEDMNTNEMYGLVRFHRFGDVRCNYTDYLCFKTKDEYEFYENIVYRKEIEFTIESEEEEHDFTLSFDTNIREIRIVCDSKNIDDFDFDGETIEDAIAYIKEKYFN